MCKSPTLPILPASFSQLPSSYGCTHSSSLQWLEPRLNFVDDFTWPGVCLWLDGCDQHGAWRIYHEVGAYVAYLFQTTFATMLGGVEAGIWFVLAIPAASWSPPRWVA